MFKSVWRLFKNWKHLARGGLQLFLDGFEITEMVI